MHAAKLLPAVTALHQISGVHDFPLSLMSPSKCTGLFPLNHDLLSMPVVRMAAVWQTDRCRLCKGFIIGTSLLERGHEAGEF